MSDRYQAGVDDEQDRLLKLAVYLERAGILTAENLRRCATTTIEYGPVEITLEDGQLLVVQSYRFLPECARVEVSIKTP